MKRFSRLFCFFIFAFAFRSVHAEKICTDGYGCAVNGSSVICDTDCTSIADSAFEGNAKIESVNLSKSSVSSIGKNAFKDCASLVLVTMPSTLSSIGNSAFELCGNLLSVNLSNTSIASIGENAFADISVPSEITVTHGSNAHSILGVNGTSTESGGAIKSNYAGSGTKLNVVGGPTPIPTEMATLTPKVCADGHGCAVDGGAVICDTDCTLIADSAFEGNARIASVNLSKTSVSSIGKNAFRNCAHLVLVTLPSALSSIGVSAFTGISVPSEITVTYGSNAHSILGANGTSTESGGPIKSNYADFWTKLNIIGGLIPTPTETAAPTPKETATMAASPTAAATATLPFDLTQTPVRIPTDTPAPIFTKTAASTTVPTATPEPKNGTNTVNEIRVVPLPEDAFGSYELDPVTGEKIYLIFNTYSICMDFLNNDELCSGNERCYHK